MSDTQTYSARWVFPASSPPVEHGVIVVQGERIVSIASRVSQRVDRDFGEAAILPGLVNAHTHLDLSGATELVPSSTDFVDWLRDVIAFRRERLGADPDFDIQFGLRQVLDAGTTLVGDISGDGSSWSRLVDAPIRSVVFRELLGLTKDRAERNWQSAQSWLGDCKPTNYTRSGLSPHAPYSARVSLVKAAAATNLPIAIHLAESEAERELLVDHSGAFVPFLKEMGVWDPLGLAKSPEHVLRLVHGAGPTMFVHCNYLADSAAIPSGASIVYCPRTHAAFDHPPWPLRERLAAGVRVALGTDSLASNPDLNILEEARFVRRIHSEVETSDILRMLTIWGAQALGWANETGSLEPGKSADFVVIPLESDNAIDPHDLWLDSQTSASETWFRGRKREPASGSFL